VAALGGIAFVVGALLALGATVTWYEQAKARRAFPPPGKIVETDGLRLHVWCEGPRAAPTILLIGGGRSQGLWMRPLQTYLRDHWRACLVDRAGMGWSGPARLPISIDSDLQEFHGALAAAGENPAAVVVGHSGGGEMAINYGGAYPNEVKALVLLDPSEPMHSVVNWRGTGFKVWIEEWTPVVETMFGLAYIDALNPLKDPKNAFIHGVFGDYWTAGVAWELRPASVIGRLSSKDAVRDDPFSIVRTPGALNGIAILLITQIPDAPRPPPHLTGRRAKNYADLLAYARREALFLSPHRAKLVYAPKDSTHYFLYTQAQFTEDKITQFLAEQFPPSARTP
jgi:pimeloyl-ACP methyl ester carboxylesterase